MFLLYVVLEYVKNGGTANCLFQSRSVRLYTIPFIGVDRFLDLQAREFQKVVEEELFTITIRTYSAQIREKPKIDPPFHSYPSASSKKCSKNSPNFRQETNLLFRILLPMGKRCQNAKKR
jgi:hypothetical protein